uniref:Ammonium_transp domain-containing protein n=1 Tax=Panagrellus redivivus TaxID=6233 RepID=A0A7E4UWA3_PANRE
MADIVQPGEGNIVALAMINTILSGAFAALVYLIIHFMFHGKWTLLLTINACLAGMVASCAGCNIMMPWACIFTGSGAGLIYMGLSKLMIRLQIDDPLDAFAVHAGGGFWGLMSVTIISKKGILYAIGDEVDGTYHWCDQAFAQFGWQLVCAIAIVLWSVGTMAPVFLGLKKIGKLRVLPEVEIKGLDIYKHGEAAYPIHAYGHGWDDIIEEDGSRVRAFSEKAEFSIEELASAYDRRTSVIPNANSRRLSYFHNPKRYEHPGLHQKALQNHKSETHNRIAPASTQNSDLYLSAPSLTIPGVVVEEAEEIEHL